MTDERDVAHEEAHPEYVNGCEQCFREAIDGSLGWLTAQAMWGVEAREMPVEKTEPLHAVFELWYEGDRLFSVTYREGDGLVLPADMFHRVRQVLEARRLQLDAAYARVDAARQAGDEDAEHSALQDAGRFGRMVDRIEGWVIR